MSGSSLLKIVKPELTNEFCSKDYLFGRNAIYAALNCCKKMGSKRIWLPSYSCGDEVAVAAYLKFDLKFYKTSTLPNLYLDINIDQIQPGDVVFFIHFFGFVDDSKYNRHIISTLKAKKCIIIEDAAYALFSENVGTFGDFIVFSLRKNLPLPHGAILCYKNNFKLQGTIAPTKELIDYEIDNFENYQKGLKKIGTGCHTGINPNNIYGARYEEFGGYNLGCSNYVIKTLADMNLIGVRLSIGNKFIIITELLSKRLPKDSLSLAQKMVSKGVCSQFLPIIVKNSRDVYKSLQKEKKYFALPFWNRMHPFLDWNKHNDSSATKGKIIALHLNHYISEEDLDILSDIILQKEKRI